MQLFNTLLNIHKISTTWSLTKCTKSFFSNAQVSLNKKGTKWEITKMKVWKEMEIFITLTKYNIASGVNSVAAASDDYLV